MGRRIPFWVALLDVCKISDWWCSTGRTGDSSSSSPRASFWQLVEASSFILSVNSFTNYHNKDEFMYVKALKIKICRIMIATAAFDKGWLPCLWRVLTLCAVSFDVARLVRFGVEYEPRSSAALFPLSGLDADKGSFLLRFRAALSCSGVGLTWIDGIAVFFISSLFLYPALYAPSPSKQSSGKWSLQMYPDPGFQSSLLLARTNEIHFRRLGSSSEPGNWYKWTLSAFVLSQNITAQRLPGNLFFSFLPVGRFWYLEAIFSLSKITKVNYNPDSNLGFLRDEDIMK